MWMVAVPADSAGLCPSVTQVALELNGPMAQPMGRKEFKQHQYEWLISALHGVGQDRRIQSGFICVSDVPGGWLGWQASLF